MNSQDDGVKAELHRLSAKLQDLHKHLLGFQARIAQEEDARKYGPYDLLRMAIHDLRFAWLRELSELITQLDIQTSDDEEGEPRDLKALVDRAVELLEGSGSDFSLGYQAALRADPHLTMTEVEVKKGLARLRQLVTLV